MAATLILSADQRRGTSSNAPSLVLAAEALLQVRRIHITERENNKQCTIKSMVQ